MGSAKEKLDKKNVVFTEQTKTEHRKQRPGMAVMKRKQPDARPSTKKVKLPIIEPEVEQSETEGSEEELLDEESEEEDESEAEIASEADSEEEEASAEGGFASEQDAVEQEELKGQVTKKKKIKVEDAAPADDTPLSQVTFASLVYFSSSSLLLQANTAVGPD